MNFDEAYQAMFRNKYSIMEHVKAEYSTIMFDYKEEIHLDWEEEESEEDFESYLDYYLEEHIDFALPTYLLGLISQVCGIPTTDLEAFPVEGKDAITAPFLICFKKLAGILDEDEDE